MTRLLDDTDPDYKEQIHSICHDVVTYAPDLATDMILVFWTGMDEALKVYKEWKNEEEFDYDDLITRLATIHLNTAAAVGDIGFQLKARGTDDERATQ